MWDRPMLKFYAKEQLKQYYWTAFLVCLVGGLLGGTGVGSGGGGSSGGSGFSGATQGASSGLSGDYGYGAVADFFSSYYILVPLLIILALVAAFAILIGNPLSVGISTYFISAPWGNREFNILFSSFRNGRYQSIVKTMFFTQLYIFLWSLLLIIPGVIKGYEYRFVPYLISENPHLSPEEAMYYSKQMSDGEKLNMWVLDLSFIGWHLLGMMALFVGDLFVTPYVEATWAQLYFALRPRVAIPQPAQW